MGSYIARQPNGLYCRFSSIVDTVTDINMTREDYIQLCQDKATEEAINTLNNYVHPFKEIKDDFAPNNMTKLEFKRLLELMELPADTVKHRKV